MKQGVWWQRDLIKKQIDPKSWRVLLRGGSGVGLKLSLTKLSADAEPLILNLKDLGAMEREFDINFKGNGTIVVQLQAAKAPVRLKTKLQVAANSKLELLVSSTSNVNWVKEANLGAFSSLVWHQIATARGAKTIAKALDQLTLRLRGEGSSFKAATGQQLSGQSFFERNWCILHEAANTCSDFLVKNVLNEAATSKEKCLVKVLPLSVGAKTSVYSHALLLDPGAKVIAAPELEVYHQDVECQHGATSGSLDVTSALYLASRGISVLETKKLLAKGFLEPMFRPFSLSKVASLVKASRSYLSLS